MTQKQLGMSSSALIPCHLDLHSQLWIFEQWMIILPATRSLQPSLFSSSASTSTSSGPDPESHWMDQPSPWTACSRMIRSTTLPLSYPASHLVTYPPLGLLVLSTTYWQFPTVSGSSVVVWSMIGQWMVLPMLPSSKVMRIFTPSLCLDSRTSILAKWHYIRTLCGLPPACPSNRPPANAGLLMLPLPIKWANSSIKQAPS